MLVAISFDSLPDATLVAQAQAGCQASIAALCTRYQPIIRAYLRARWFRGMPEVADDLTSDVMERLLLHVRSFEMREANSLRAWVYRLAHNRAVDWFRGPRSARSIDEARTVDSPLADCGERKSSSLDDALEDRQTARTFEHIERTELLTTALAALPTDEQRQVVAYRWLEDYSILATAALMGKHPDAIKQLQVRAFANMRAHFAAAGITAWEQVQ